jgi:hypothetical protein
MNLLFIACLCLTLLGEFFVAIKELVIGIYNWFHKESEFRPARFLWTEKLAEDGVGNKIADSGELNSLDQAKNVKNKLVLKE